MLAQENENYVKIDKKNNYNFCEAWNDIIFLQYSILVIRTTEKQATLERISILMMVCKKSCLPNIF